MGKTGKKLVCFGLILCTAAYIWNAPAAVRNAEASAVTSESIREKENQIAQAKKEKESLQGSLTNIQKLKKELEKQKANLANYIKQLDENLAQIDRNIEELKEKISDKEEEIRLTEGELEAAIKREEDQKEAVRKSIRLIYEVGSPNLWEMILSSKSFADFLNKADYVEKVLSYSHRLLEDYEGIRVYVELCREKLELEKDILNDTKAGVEKEQQSLEELIEQKSQDILSYETDIRTQEKAIKEYEAEIKAQEEEIKTLEALVAEEKKKLLESQKLKYDGGVFKFPLATYTRVTDNFGWRIHPIFKYQQFHSGVDFAAPKGTAIYAAYDGKVSAATYSSSMGNYVMIDHGDGLYTIYMHASALYVKKDEVVVKGQTIAAVGSTGNSTGNHLHFTVRLNGEYVSPWNYLSQ